MQKLKICAAGIAACCVLFAAGCAGASADVGAAEVELLESDGARVVLFVREGDGEKSLYNALAAFNEKGEIALGGSESEFGFYITSVNGVAETDDHYWAVYTSLGECDGTSYSDAAWGTYEYEGHLLASASLGVSGLPLEEGAYFALVYTPMAA